MPAAPPRTSAGRRPQGTARSRPSQNAGSRADQPDFLHFEKVEIEPFLEDVFLRWSEVAPRAWRLGPIACGRLRLDPQRLRAALDALLENAVKFTQPPDAIEL